MPDDYHALAKKRGFKWLGPEVANVLIKTGWQCGQGHQWQAHYSHIRAGYGCRTCAIIASRHPPAAYHRLAEKRGFRWLGPEVPNVAAKTGWQCGQGHQWQASYANTRAGSDCPTCVAIARRHPPAAYHRLAEKRGFRWLGPEVFNGITNTGWQCGQGHQWQATYANIRRGHDCPTCAAIASRHPPAAYHHLAEKRGFRWLGPEVLNAKTKTGWQCGKGHQWQANYANIRIGHGCPTCAAIARRRQPVDYHALAEKRGFRWLGPEAPNATTKTGWQCEQGHQWQTTYAIIRTGSGCPICAGKRQPE